MQYFVKKFEIVTNFSYICIMVPSEVPNHICKK